MSAWIDSSPAATMGSPPRINPIRRAAKTISPPAATHAVDGRWVLAHRTAEMMQGTILTPEDRQTLNRLGAILGLTPFDTALVIAVVQDQARRGLPAKHRPLAAYQTLQLIGQPGGHRPACDRSGWSLKRIGRWIVGIAVILMIELAMLAALL